MTYFENVKSPGENDIFPFNKDEEEEEDAESKEKKGEEIENLGELEEIEAKIDKGEDISASSLDYSALPKSRIVYLCPRCKRIYWNKKWVKDTVTAVFTVRTELAYCPKCLGKAYDNFVGIVEIYDKKLTERRAQFEELTRQVEREIEDIMPFETIINITVKNDVLFIFTNTTRLALEIGKRLRQEFQGAVQYEWFERNQYLRVKWFDELENRDQFKKRIRELREFRFGIFSFED